PERRARPTKPNVFAAREAPGASSGDSGYCGGDTVGGKCPFWRDDGVGVLSVNTLRKTTESYREGGPRGPVFPLFSAASAGLRTSTETSDSSRGLKKRSTGWMW